jgi:hypothetical protein
MSRNTANLIVMAAIVVLVIAAISLTVALFLK